MFLGHTFTGNLIYRNGETSTAVTVSIRQTNNQYNDYWIMEHSIIIRAKEGDKYETSFEDADFNIYPELEQGYVYPVAGETYFLKYLKSNPKAFVIVSDDSSPYAKRIKCEDIRYLYDEVLQKYKFDSLNSDTEKII